MEKVAIVTGASRGIGREIAKSLAKKGMQVIANYCNSEKKAKELQEELRQEGIKIDIVKADVSKRSEIKNLVEYAIEKYKKVDILINNAGISEYKLFTDEKDEDWNNVIGTNLYSAYAMSQEIIPKMLQNGKGCIINISSVWGEVGASMEVLYSVSKAGLNGLTKALAKELGPSNIRVNAVSPGIIDTEMNSHLMKEEIKEIEQEIPLQRIGRVEDIAKCINWLVEDNYTTGQIITVDGGWFIT